MKQNLIILALTAVMFSGMMCVLSACTISQAQVLKVLNNK